MQAKYTSMTKMATKVCRQCDCPHHCSTRMHTVPLYQMIKIFLKPWSRPSPISNSMSLSSRSGNVAPTYTPLKTSGRTAIKT